MSLQELRCADCGGRVIIRAEDMFPEQEVVCPYCGEVIYIDEE